VPLKAGSSRKTVSGNISEMVHAGHPQDQAVAASLRNARKTKRKGVRNMNLSRDRKKGRHTKRGHKRG